MLSSLHIENYAILDEVDITFDDQVNIITGETGAGKSILLGALGLVMGKRADTNVLFDKSAKCIVEAHFKDYPASLNKLLQELDLDVEPQLIIRREIIPSGRSRAFINDTPTTLTSLHQISSSLVDLNQQFHTYELKNKEFHGELIDAMAGSTTLQSQYAKLYTSYAEAQRKLSEIKNISAAQLKEMEFIKFQLKEFEQIELQSGEIEEKEKELQLIEKHEDLTTLVQETSHVIQGAEMNLENTISELIRKWEGYKDLDEKSSSLYETLLAAMEQVQAANQINEHIGDSVDMDPVKIKSLKDRLDVLFSLQRKHAAQSTQDLLDIQESLAQDIGKYENRDSSILSLETEISKMQSQLQEWAEKLSAKRKKVFAKLEKSVNSKLNELAMPSAELKVEHFIQEQLGKNGIDDIKFLFKANKGTDYQPIGKVASGGESSRLMLALKSTIAGKMALPTMIFDEIDTGVSGKVAIKMGTIIADLGKRHQIICITHSPQVASRATTHMHVYKEETSDRTVTRVTSLEKGQRMQELAKMLSGDPPSTFALENAKELMES